MVDGRTVAVLTFSGEGVVAGSLPDGFYTLIIHADLIYDGLGRALDGDGNGTPGGDHLAAFFRLYGVSDGDWDVDEADRALFDAALGMAVGDPGFLDYFDFDGDGDIDKADQAEFLLRLVVECIGCSPPNGCIIGGCPPGPGEDP